jgi:hypothetical protein
VTTDIDRAPVHEALAWPDKAAALVITTAESYTGAAELLKAIKGLRAKIAETFGPHIKRAFDAHKALVAEQRAAEDPLTQAESAIKGKLIAYDREQERIRREAEAAAREAARRDEEQRRLDEAAALEREAAATGNLGLQAEAEALIAAPVEVAPVIVAKQTPKVAGISYRETWAFEVTDLGALVKHVSQNPGLLHLLRPNDTAIGQMVRAQREGFKVPGIITRKDRQVAAGRWEAR